MQTLCRDILKCLLFLKKYGIVHCDLKPENILVKNEQTMNVKIIDFGSCSFLDSQDYDYLQSRPYRAPEVVMGGGFDFASDMWSVGCILYELISHEVLFNFKTAQENFVKAMSINNIIDFQFFNDTKKYPKYFSQNGFILIPDQTGNERGYYRTAFPKEGIDFKSEVSLLTENKSLVDFIVKCLVFDPIHRLTIEEAIDHPFIKSSLKNK